MYFPSPISSISLILICLCSMIISSFTYKRPLPSPGITKNSFFFGSNNIHACFSLDTEVSPAKTILLSSFLHTEFLPATILYVRPKFTPLTQTSHPTQGSTGADDMFPATGFLEKNPVVLPSSEGFAEISFSCSLISGVR